MLSSSHWTRRSFLARGTAAVALPSLARALPLVPSAPPGKAALVDTPTGTLRGETVEGIRIFRGVSFAQPPLGELRFRPPTACKPWSGVRDATHFAAAAVQQGDRKVPQSEDCLYLNVWTPELHAGSPALPVFVWIHGGGFTGGEAFAPVFDGSVFARQGVVLVTVAYRLGVLGFLDVEPLLGTSYAGSANNALRDLMMAFSWVQANIGAFGGDPHQVTIGGESAGAKLTDLLTGVPSARGLFHGMISESGGAERIWPRAVAQGVSEGFGRAWAQATAQPAAALRTAPARQLIDVQTSFLKSWPQHFPLRAELDGDLFPEAPLRTIAGGSARGKRLLIGTNRDESALFLGPDPQHDPTAADLGNMGLPAFEQVLAKYSSVYPEMTAAQRRIRATTAEEYWVPSVRVADAAAAAGAEVYAYELAYARGTGPYKGQAYHSEDIALVWDAPQTTGAGAAAEASMARQMNTAWAAFVQGKSPSAPGLPVWPRYTPQQRLTMMLNTTSTVEAQPQEAELRLWGVS